MQNTTTNLFITTGNQIHVITIKAYQIYILNQSNMRLTNFFFFFFLLMLYGSRVWIMILDVRCEKVEAW